MLLLVVYTNASAELSPLSAYMDLPGCSSGAVDTYPEAVPLDRVG